VPGDLCVELGRPHHRRRRHREVGGWRASLMSLSHVLYVSEPAHLGSRGPRFDAVSIRSAAPCNTRVEGNGQPRPAMRAFRLPAIRPSACRWNGTTVCRSRSNVRKRVYGMAEETACRLPRCCPSCSQADVLPSLAAEQLNSRRRGDAIITWQSVAALLVRARGLCCSGPPMAPCAPSVQAVRRLRSG